MVNKKVHGIFQIYRLQITVIFALRKMKSYSINRKRVYYNSALDYRALCIMCWSDFFVLWLLIVAVFLFFV